MTVCGIKISDERIQASVKAGMSRPDAIRWSIARLLMERSICHSNNEAQSMAAKIFGRAKTEGDAPPVDDIDPSLPFGPKLPSDAPVQDASDYDDGDDDEQNDEESERKKDMSLKVPTNRSEAAQVERQCLDLLDKAARQLQSETRQSYARCYEMALRRNSELYKLYSYAKSLQQ